jgi:hypothetical protein
MYAMGRERPRVRPAMMRICMMKNGLMKGFVFEGTGKGRGMLV